MNYVPKSYNDLKKEIVQRLKKYHSGKWVSPPVAIGSLYPKAFQALESLIEEKIIDRKFVYVAGCNAPLVRYVDTSWMMQLKIIDGDKE